MRIETDGWVMEVDLPLTRSYSDRELAENCQCDDCRNYYACVDAHYPELREFLLDFGVQIHAPEEMSTYKMGESVLYCPQFSVGGRILRTGDRPIRVGQLSVTPMEDPFAAERMGTTAFSLCVDDFLLPWVLEESGKKRFGSFIRRRSQTNIES